MSERIFRIILGLGLMALLVLDTVEYIYAYIAILMFEGITNLRIPSIISRLRYGENHPTLNNTYNITFKNFEAERMLRILVALFLFISYVLFYELLWFLPWFMAVMLLLAGLTNICPMIMSLRWTGFK